MSKPLELIIFEKEPGRYGREPIYNSPDGFWAYPASHVDGYAANKHLTDAELAAEMFSAVFHESECEVKARQLGEGHPAFNHWLKANHEYARQAEIVERFATLPHYDEPQP